MSQRLGRRRFIALIGAAAGMSLLPFGRIRADLPAFDWTGRALGAEARIRLSLADKAEAERLISRCIDEVARLERVFSLFQHDSELAQLNRDGRLDGASIDLRVVLGEARRIAELTGGAFDPSIQPLWRLYADRFGEAPDGDGPSFHEIQTALSSVDYRAVDIEGSGVRLGLPGMALTLNGIAQGYITDRAAGLLRAGGCERVLIQLGETRAVGPDWRVAVPESDQVLDLDNSAIATTAGAALAFDAAGRFHHVLDPRSGLSARHWRSVSVIAASAMAADALSTGLSVVAAPATPAFLKAANVRSVLYRACDGAASRVDV